MTPIRRRIETELGIAFNHIMITATHNHSAPRIGRSLQARWLMQAAPNPMPIRSLSSIA